MTDENKIKEELLKQAKTNAPFDPEAINQMLQKEEQIVKFIKCATIWAWILTGFLAFMLNILRASLSRARFDGLTVAEAVGLTLSSLLPTILGILATLTIALTVLLYSRSRTLSIKQINARLAGIEEQLKKIAGT